VYIRPAVYRTFAKCQVIQLFMKLCFSLTKISQLTLSHRIYDIEGLIAAFSTVQGIYFNQVGTHAFKLLQRSTVCVHVPIDTT